MPVRWLQAAGVLIFVVAASLFIFYRPKPAPPPQPAVLTPQQVPVTPPPPSEIDLTGTVEAVKVLNVPVPVNGTVEQFLAAVGDEVTEGQLLARIRNPQLTSSLEQAKADAERARTQVSSLEAELIGAKLEVSRADADVTRAKLEYSKAEKEYEKQQMMMRDGVTPRVVFEKAEQEYKVWKTQWDNAVAVAKAASDRVDSLNKSIEIARKSIDKTAGELDSAQTATGEGNVDSPADGIVIARHGNSGEPVNTSIQDLFQIAVDLSLLQVVLTPSPEDLARTKPGQPAAIEIKEVPGKTQGKVREVKDGRVTIEFTSPAPTIKPGMTATVKIKVG